MLLDLDWLRLRLPGRRLEYHASIPTTMTEAARLASEGCPSGTVVLADEQTAGRGRFSRSWHSQRGEGLYFTVILRLPLAADQIPTVTLALGLAVHDALLLTTGIAADLKWPNDVLVEGRKCAGILTQYQDGAILAGIGVNVSQERFPPELALAATSLRLATGKSFPREPLLVALLRSIDSFTGILVRNGAEPVLQMFENSSSFVRGRRIIVEEGGEVADGVSDGLTAQGFLRLRKDDGRIVTVYSGSVRPAW